MNSRPPTFFTQPPPLTPPEPVAPPVVSTRERIAAFGWWSLLVLLACCWLVIVLWLVRVGDGWVLFLGLAIEALLLAGAVFMFQPLREITEATRLRIASLWQEHEERGAYLALGRRWVALHLKKTYGRQPAHEQPRVILVRDGSHPTAPTWDGKARSVAPTRARVTSEGVPQPADTERITTHLPELGGPAVWTAAMATMQTLRFQGVRPTWENCRNLGISREDWSAAKAAFERMDWLAQGGRGKAAEWRDQA